MIIDRCVRVSSVLWIDNKKDGLNLTFNWVKSRFSYLLPFALPVSVVPLTAPPQLGVDLVQLLQPPQVVVQSVVVVVKVLVLGGHDVN